MTDDTQETMTVDEATEHARNIAMDIDFDRNAERGQPAHFENADRNALKLLAAEVERLRKLHSEDEAQVACRNELRAKVNEYAERCDKLREHNEQLRAKIRNTTGASEDEARTAITSGRQLAAEVIKAAAAVSDAPAPSSQLAEQLTQALVLNKDRNRIAARHANLLAVLGAVIRRLEVAYRSGKPECTDAVFDRLVDAYQTAGATDSAIADLDAGGRDDF